MWITYCPILIIYACTEKLSRKIYIKLLTAVTYGGKYWKSERIRNVSIVLSDLNLIRTFYKGNTLLENLKE